MPCVMLQNFGNPAGHDRVHSGGKGNQTGLALLDHLGAPNMVLIALFCTTSRRFCWGRDKATTTRAQVVQPENLFTVNPGNHIPRGSLLILMYEGHLVFGIVSLVSAHLKSLHFGVKRGDN